MEKQGILAGLIRSLKNYTKRRALITLFVLIFIFLPLRYLTYKSEETVYCALEEQKSNSGDLEYFCFGRVYAGTGGVEGYVDIFDAVEYLSRGELAIEDITIQDEKVKKENPEKRIYYCFDDGQGAILFYKDAEWAKEFEQKTDISLRTR